MPKPTLPKCPCCKRTKTVSRVGIVGDMFRCSQCGMFDNEPEEGGDHSNHNPAARLERQERNRKQFNRR